MRSELYTFLLDFKGGTYVSQVRGEFGEACGKWAEQMKLPELEPYKSELVRQIAEEDPIQVEGYQNVWCVSALLDGEIALIHFIKTV